MWDSNVLLTATYAQQFVCVCGLVGWKRRKHTSLSLTPRARKEWLLQINIKLDLNFMVLYPLQRKHFPSCPHCKIKSFPFGQVSKCPGRLCQPSGVSVPLSAGRNQHWHSGSSLDSAPHECLWQRPKAFGSLGLQFIERDTAGWFKTTSQWFKCNAPEWSATTGARTNSYLSPVPGGRSRTCCVNVLCSHAYLSAGY